MNLIDEIITALLLLGPDDLRAAKAYLAWMQIRRAIHHRFYFAAHWVDPREKYHWVGKS